MELIYGKNPVREALRSGRRIHRLFVADTLKGTVALEICRLAEERGVVVERLRVTEMNRMAGHSKHQGLIAEVERFRYANVEDVLKTAAVKEEAPLLALLDGVEDPHNLGAIIRSAEAAGAHGIVIPRDRSASVTSIVEKTAAGATAHLPVVQVTNLVRTMERLKKQGIWMFGADLEGQQDLWETDLSGPAGIVLGGEDRGLRRLVRKNCDFFVRIPMFGKMSSLNVSVAAGVVFFEAARQRRCTKNVQP